MLEAKAFKIQPQQTKQSALHFVLSKFKSIRENRYDLRSLRFNGIKDDDCIQSTKITLPNMYVCMCAKI